ncbi:MAG: AmmeMemoRadiSam system radical SAM enzyme [Candidatus Aminicenantes bacterium]|nr:AmmeMemoRadiSam system radical SAM enzyme [Candidatus Aminicenantes bacterium]
MTNMERREFLRAAAGAGLVLGTDGRRVLADAYAFGQKPSLSRVEARYYKKLEDREVECELCPRRCRLGDKERGYCGVRENDGGTYLTLVYGKPCTMNADPIEKKPFFHVLPGTRAFSIATAGCNVNCKFCQNWEISQVRAEQLSPVDLSPAEAARTAVDYGCRTVAYTYSEPVVFYEYMFDTAVEARKLGVRSVVVTGGYINPEPLEALTKVVSAIKVDLKAFNQDFYADYVRGDLQPVLEAVKLISRSRVWMELVYLVIPTLNDAPDEIRRMSRWILKEVGPDVPLHFTRFQPMYLIKNLPPTPVSTLESLRRIALEEGVHFVYTGNVPGHEGENTYCPKCRRILVRRYVFDIEAFDIKEGRCPSCQTPIPGMWA